MVKMTDITIAIKIDGTLPPLFSGELPPLTQSRCVITPQTLERLTVPADVADRLRRQLGHDEPDDNDGTDPMRLMRFFPVRNLRTDLTRCRSWLSFKLWDLSCAAENLSDWVSPYDQ